MRDLEVELVFRNAVFTQYMLDANLYHKEGMGARNRAQNAAIKLGDIGKAQRLPVRFRTEATMVTADFVSEEIMLARGLIQKQDASGNSLTPPNNPDYPYITILMGKTAQNAGQHFYLLAMINASKTLPNWHLAAHRLAPRR